MSGDLNAKGPVTTKKCPDTNTKTQVATLLISSPYAMASMLSTHFSQFLPYKYNLKKNWGVHLSPKTSSLTVAVWQKVFISWSAMLGWLSQSLHQISRFIRRANNFKKIRSLLWACHRKMTKYVLKNQKGTKKMDEHLAELRQVAGELEFLDRGERQRERFGTSRRPNPSLPKPIMNDVSSDSEFPPSASKKLITSFRLFCQLHCAGFTGSLAIAGTFVCLYFFVLCTLRA